MCHSIDALRCCLESYDGKLWSILHEQETCEASVRELEEVLAAAAALMDKEEELAQERVRDEVKRQLATHQRATVEESKEEDGEEKGDKDDEDELDGSSGLSAKVRGKQPAK